MLNKESKVKRIFPVFFFAMVILSVPHGIVENLAMVGLLLCAGLWVWQTFRPTKRAPDKGGQW